MCTRRQNKYLGKNYCIPFSEAQNREKDFYESWHRERETECLKRLESCPRLEGVTQTEFKGRKIEFWNEIEKNGLAT